MSVQYLSTSLVFVLTAFAATAEQSPILKQDVMLGGNPTLDACSSTGRVAGLKDVEGNFLALRTHPSTQGDLINKLENDQPLRLCEEVDGWFGVVIPNTSLDCGTSSPIAIAAPYAGECDSGWVYGKFVVPEAG